MRLWQFVAFGERERGALMNNKRFGRLKKMQHARRWPVAGYFKITQTLPNGKKVAKWLPSHGAFMGEKVAP